MKRRLKLEVIIDYEEMLKTYKVKSEGEYHLSEREIEAIDLLCENINQWTRCNEAPTQQAVGYLPIGLIDVASGDSSQSLQAAGYLNENELNKELEVNNIDVV